MALQGAKKLLYVLTGIEPHITTGSYDKLHTGEHVRFSFPTQDASFHQVKTLLKLLDIQHCAELFKHVEPRQGPTQLSYFITIGSAACANLMSYVAPGAAMNAKAKASDKVIKFVDRIPHVEHALRKWLLDRDFLEQIKQRNKDYNLDGIMLYFAQLMLNSIPCFSYLSTQGIKPSFSVELEVEEDSEAGPAILTAHQMAGEKREPRDFESSEPVPSKFARLGSK